MNNAESLAARNLALAKQQQQQQQTQKQTQQIQQPQMAIVSPAKKRQTLETLGNGVSKQVKGDHANQI